MSEAIPPLRAARKRPVPKLVGSSAPPIPARPWIASAAWVAAAVIVFIATGFWLAHTRGSSGIVTPRLAAAPSESNTESVKAAATDVRVPLMSSTATSPPADRMAATPLREPIDPRTMPSSIAVPRPASPPAAVTPAERMPGTPVFGAGPVDAVPAPAPVVVAQAPPAPRPAPDRWQRLSEALARCPANDTIARTLCQESLRIESCEGYWGRVAACPARVEREYGN